MEGGRISATARFGKLRKNDGRNVRSASPVVWASEEFRGGEFAAGIVPTCRENVPGVQQGRSMVGAGSLHGARRRPGPGRWIVSRAASEHRSSG